MDRVRTVDFKLVRIPEPPVQLREPESSETQPSEPGSSEPELSEPESSEPDRRHDVAVRC